MLFCCKVQCIQICFRSVEAYPERSPHMIAAICLLNAMVAGEAIHHEMVFPVLLQALLGLLPTKLSLVVIAALVAVPLHVAFPAPLVPACITLQRCALLLCIYTIITLPDSSVLALRITLPAVQAQSHRWFYKHGLRRSP